MKNRVKRFLSRLKIKFYIWSKKSSGIIPTYQDETLSYERPVLRYVLK
jgi:hypothetical protein